MAEQLVRFPGPGCVVEFLQGNQPVQAWVLEGREAQLRLYAVNKREFKIPAVRLLPWSGPAYSQGASRAEMQSRLEAHKAKREDLAAGIDLGALWELVQGEEAQGEAVWLAGFLWPDPDVDSIAALGQAMLAKKTHFKFSPPVFEIYTAPQVEQRLEKQVREDRQQMIIQAGAEFFRKLHEAAGRQQQISPEDIPPPDAAESLRELLLERIADPEAHDPENLWKMLVKGLGERRDLPGRTEAEDPYLALRLAVGWGIVPEHHNYLLDQAGYAAGDAWAGEQEFACAALRREVETRLRVLPEVEGLVSIDPASTVDWDDALSVRPDGEGYDLAIAIACPSLAWPFGSPLDKAVLRRSSSLYLPEGNLYMLPQEVCRETFSLEAGKDRPALILRVDLDKEMNLVRAEPFLGRVRLEENIPLARSEAALQDGSPEGRITLLYRLALALRQKRLEKGAIITEREDPEITLEKDDQGTVYVRVAPGENYGRSHALVSEFMVLYNAALAEWARDRGIPLIHRTQPVALPKDHAGVWTTPQDINRALQGLPPAKLSVEPRPHTAVGVPLYSSFTSPLRRYLDLLNQAQVLHYLDQNHPRLNQEELGALLPLIASRLETVGQIQRYRVRYWKLVYLQQEQKKKGTPHYWPATVVEENNSWVSVHLDLLEMPLRGPRALFGERVLPGAAVGVRLGRINPLRNEVQIMETADY